jgi:hypothetical protein
MASRGKRVAVALALAAAVIAIAVADYAITAGKIPDVPPPCGSVTDAACNDERNDLFEERLDRLFELEDGLESRFGIYSIALILIGVGFAAAGVRGQPRASEDWATTFRDLGTGAVGWLIVGWVALRLPLGGNFLAFPATIIWQPALALVIVAGVGSLAAAGSGREPGEDPPPTTGTLDKLSGAALIAAGIGCALMMVGAAGQGDCGGETQVWAERTLGVGVAVAVAGVVLGVVNLFRRRWVTALICTVAPVFVGLLSFLAVACLS